MSRLLAVMLTVLCSSLLVPAQQPKVLAPHKPVRPRLQKRLPFEKPIPGSIVGGPWMIDANFKSTLYLKNVVETDPVTVTPILYLSNGAKFSLPDVTLEPAGTAVIDINEGLRQQGIAPWATLVGYAEIQYSVALGSSLCDHP
jgi:hypothetical protein